MANSVRLARGGLPQILWIKALVPLQFPPQRLDFVPQVP